MASSNNDLQKDKTDKNDKKSVDKVKSENKTDVKDKAKIKAEKSDINEWLDTLKNFTPTLWEHLPELDLYMDQVVTLLNRQLSAFSKQGENLLTPSMINNYVKDGVLPRPEKKKYTKDHLAMLMMICSLKSVLSLPEIHTLLDGLSKEKNIKEQYPEFLNIINQTHDEVISRIAGDIDLENKESIFALALTLALEANIRNTVASKILLSLAESDIPD